MKIEIKNSPIANDFENLETGDVFEFRDSYYMVITYETINEYNAVCLCDGELTRFEPEDKVYLKNATLTIF